MEFPYKTVLMVGATSGIGLALARRILDETPDAHVVAVGRRAENLAALQAEYGAARVSTAACDVSDTAGLPAFAQR